MSYTIAYSDPNIYRPFTFVIFLQAETESSNLNESDYQHWLFVIEKCIPTIS